MKILIVDDQEANNYLLESLLKGNGHEVLTAANGQEAWELLRTHPVDLIISDILMPVMDGFQLCRKIKTNQDLKHLPFIIYTATYTGPKDEEFALKIGADRFIVKPCEPDAFIKAVHDVMKKHPDENDEPLPPVPNEEVLKLYNERLVRKLEKKMLELENEVQTRRESQEKYKSILDNITDGYYEVDLAGNLTFFNHSMCRILGYSDQELLGMNNRTFMDGENAEKVFQTFNHVYTTGEPRRALDWELIRKDGKKCSVDTSVSLIKDAEGKSIGFRGVARDVTEHKKAEKDKQRLAEQLQQAQKLESIGRLAGGVAHDFNNLLLIIQGYTEMVLNDLDKEHTHHEPLEQVYQAGLRAKSLTQQLLAFSRNQVLKTRVAEINAVVTGFEKLLGRLIGEDVHLAITRTTTTHLPVKADIAQLEQVLMNLAINARDAMPDGGTLRIETSKTELDDYAIDGRPGVLPGSYAVIHVSDTGCGMDKTTLDRIFEPFFTTKEPDKGTGLGLATSYGIIRQHNGDIRVHSEPGKGSTFTIYLPLSPDPPAGMSG